MRSEAATTCAHVRAVAMRKLRRLTRQATRSVNAPMPAVAVRMLNGGISFSAIFIAGQVMPQIRQSRTSISFARTSPTPIAAGLAARCSRTVIALSVRQLERVQEKWKPVFRPDAR